MLFKNLDFGELTETIAELNCVIHQSSFDGFDNFQTSARAHPMHLSVSHLRIIELSIAFRETNFLSFLPKIRLNKFFYKFRFLFLVSFVEQPSLYTDSSFDGGLEKMKINWIFSLEF